MKEPEDNIQTDQPITITVGGKNYTYKRAVIGLAKRAQKFFLGSTLTPRYEDTGKDVPDEYWLLLRAKNLQGSKDAIGGAGFDIRKNADGSWKINKVVSPYDAELDSPEWAKLNEDWKEFCAMVLENPDDALTLENITFDEFDEVSERFFPFRKTMIRQSLS